MAALECMICSPVVRNGEAKFVYQLTAIVILEQDFRVQSLTDTFSSATSVDLALKHLKPFNQNHLSLQQSANTIKGSSRSK